MITKAAKSSVASIGRPIHFRFLGFRLAWLQSACVAVSYKSPSDRGTGTSAPAIAYFAIRQLLYYRLVAPVPLFPVLFHPVSPAANPSGRSGSTPGNSLAITQATRQAQYGLHPKLRERFIPVKPKRRPAEHPRLTMPQA
jgi:hypothetical protein